MHRRTCLVAVLVSIPIAAGIGISVVLGWLSGVSLGLRSSATSLSAGVHLEKLTEVEELFALAGHKAVVLKYSGGDVDFWVEIETQGKKQKVGQGLGSQCREKRPGPNETIEGYLLLVCSEADDSGRETWCVASQRDVVTESSSGAQVPIFLASANLSQSRENKQSVSASSRQLVQVGESTKPQRANPVAGRDDGVTTDSQVSTATFSVPNPLPPGKDVCITEIRAKRKKGTEFVRVYTIKVMCKAASALEATPIPSLQQTDQQARSPDSELSIENHTKSTP